MEPLRVKTSFAFIPRKTTTGWIWFKRYKAYQEYLPHVIQVCYKTTGFLVMEHYYRPEVRYYWTTYKREQLCTN